MVRHAGWRCGEAVHTADTKSWRCELALERQARHAGPCQRMDAELAFAVCLSARLLKPSISDYFPALFVHFETLKSLLDAEKPRAPPGFHAWRNRFC